MGLAAHIATMSYPLRMGASALLAFALVALVMACVGLYGAVSYAVSQRSREVGIRLSLGAGRGSVIVPHGADQFYWGDLLYARGVAAKPLKRPALTASALATRLRAVLGDTSMAARAAELSTAMRAERGSERAAETIARCLGPSG